MAVSTAFLNAAADAMGDLITHVGLVDDSGTELSGGSYARKAVTWGSASAGKIAPTGDLTFDVPASTTVGGWRGYSASTSGTDYGGSDLTHETYAGAGQYKLLAASTGYEPTTGSYWLWSRVGDTPEVIPRRHDKITIS